METKNTNNPFGRPKGSTNKLSNDIKEDIYEPLRRHLRKLESLISITDQDKKAKLLCDFLPYIFIKEDEQTDELRTIIFNALLPHFKIKFNTYISMIPQEQKAKVLLRFMKELSPAQKKRIAAILNEES